MINDGQVANYILDPYFFAVGPDSFDQVNFIYSNLKASFNKNPGPKNPDLV